MGWARAGGFSSLPNPLWCCVQGSCPVPCFCSWHLRNGSWFLASLYLIHNLPYLCMHAALFSPLFFLGILLLQEAFVQVQALQGKPRMPGSQVPDYLNRTSWEVFPSIFGKFEDWCSIFLKLLSEFTSEATWARPLLCGKLFDY